MNSFGDRLRESRTRAGLTQDQLGFVIGVTNSAVSAWENDRDVPSFGALLKLQQSLSVDMHWLLVGTGRAASQSAINESPEKYVYVIPPQLAKFAAENHAEKALLQRFRATTARKRSAVLDLLVPDAAGTIRAKLEKE